MDESTDLERHIETEENFLYTPTDQMNDILPEMRALGWGGKAMLTSYLLRITAGVTKGDIYTTLPLSDWMKGAAVAIPLFIMSGSSKARNIGSNLRDKIADLTEIKFGDVRLYYRCVNTLKKATRLALIDPKVDKAVGYGFWSFFLIHMVGETKEMLGYNYDLLFPETVEDAKAYTTFHEAIIGVTTGAYAKLKSKIKDKTRKGYAKVAAKAAGFTALVAGAWEAVEVGLFGSTGYGNTIEDWVLDTASDAGNAIITSIVAALLLHKYMKSSPRRIRTSVLRSRA